jgi:hypothetical protein
LDAFFNEFGITRRRIASFELPVKKSEGKAGFIDMLWRGQLLDEHKLLGKSLVCAFLKRWITLLVLKSGIYLNTFSLLTSQTSGFIT